MLKATFESMASYQQGVLDIDWVDLDNNVFTPTVDLAKRYETQGQLWFVVGGDIIAGGKTGRSQIQSSWKSGLEIWQDLHWACLERPGFYISPEDLPPQARLLPCNIPGSSTTIRQEIRAKHDIGSLVVDRVQAIIKEYKLYQEL